MLILRAQELITLSVHRILVTTVLLEGEGLSIRAIWMDPHSESMQMNFTSLMEITTKPFSVNPCYRDNLVLITGNNNHISIAIAKLKSC